MTPEEMRVWKREWVARRRADWFEANGPCLQCSSWEDLQLDHINPDTKTSHTIWSWSRVRRDAELSKCQILCKRCHLAKTREDRRRHIPEGKSWCTMCQLFLPIDEFHRDRSSLLGFTSRCKTCDPKYKRLRRNRLRERSLTD